MPQAESKMEQKYWTRFILAVGFTHTLHNISRNYRKLRALRCTLSNFTWT